MFINIYTHEEFTQSDLVLKGISASANDLSNLGIYPLTYAVISEPRPFIECAQFCKEEIVAGTFIRYSGVQAFTVVELLLYIPFHHADVGRRFAIAFSEIDYRSTRATQDITARNVEIATIEKNLTKVSGQAAEELSGLRAELLKSNADDGRVLVEMRQIAEENRAMQAELLALEITEDMTLEQAQEITLRIANATPWLPWRDEPEMPKPGIPVSQEPLVIRQPEPVALVAYTVNK